MSRNVFVLLLILLPFAGLRAQDMLLLTLDSVLRLAENNLLAYRNQLLDRSIADASYREGRQRFLPQISTTYELRANPVRPTNIIPGAPFGQADDLEIRFGTLWSSTAALEINQTLYDRLLKEDQRLLELERQIAGARVALGRDDARLNAVSAYYNLLVQKARLAQQEAYISRLQTDLADTDTRVQSGLALPIDLERFQHAFRNALLERNKLLSGIEQGELTLRHLCGMPPMQTFRLVDTLDLYAVRADLLLAPLPERPDLNNFAQYRLENLNQARLEHTVSLQKAAVVPTLHAFGYAGAQLYTNDPRDQFPWYGVVYLGVRLGWRMNPLWENKHALERIELERRQSENRIRQLGADLLQSTALARSRLLQAIEEAEIQADNVAFARKEAIYFGVRYRSSLATSREVIDAEKEWSRAEIELLISVYNVYLARYEYLKTLGKG